MSELTATIFLTIIGSNALFTFIQFLITRRDTKKSIKDKLILLEKDILRTQLLLLILLKPEEEQEIFTVGQHYFRDLKGNWYMTGIFNKWLKEYKHAEPEWFTVNSST